MWRASGESISGLIPLVSGAAEGSWLTSELSTTSPPQPLDISEGSHPLPGLLVTEKAVPANTLEI